MDSKVEVFISTSNPDSHNVKSLVKLFLSPLFEVKPIIIPNSSVVLDNNFDIESYRLLEILKKSDPGKYTLFLKDNSTTNTTCKGIDIIFNFILKEKGWDVCYLSKWLDRCDLYNKNGFNRIKGLNSYLVRTSSPNGIQSLIFSPKGKQVILGIKKMRVGYFKPLHSMSNSLRVEIEKNNIHALAVTPNVFNFNVLYSKSVSDLAKLSECRRPIHTDLNNNSSSIPGATPLFWFIAVIIIIILILWSLFQLGVRPRNQSAKKDE